MRPFLLFLFISILVSCGSSSDEKALQTGGVTNFTGSWSLSSVNHTSTGINENCTANDITVVQEDTRVVVGPRSYNCGNYAYAFSEMQFEVTDNKLTFAGLDAGEIGTNFIHIRVDYEGNGHTKISLDSYEDRTTLRESSTSNGSPYLVFTALINQK